MSALVPTDVPRLPPGVRLKHDAARGTTVLLAPERAFTLNAVAVSVLELVDGQRSAATIAGILATRFGADGDVVLADVLGLLSDLAGKRVVAKQVRAEHGAPR